MTHRAVLVLTALLLLAAGPIEAVAEEGSFDRTLKVSGVVQLRINNGSGGITVRRGAEGSLRVQGRIRANTNWGWFGGNPTGRVKDVEQNPPIRQTGNIVTIGNDVQRWDNVSITYDLTVPQQTQVSAENGSGSIQVYDVRGPAELHTGSGTIRADNIAGLVHARTGSGSITIDGAKDEVTADSGSGSIQVNRVEGSVAADTASGQVTVSSASGRIRAVSSSGGVTIQRAQADVEARSSSGSISIDGRPKSARWEARASSGSIHVSLPPGTGFEVDASTTSGSVSTSHSVTTSGAVGRKQLRGVAGRPDNKLHLQTGSGSIRID